VAYNDNLPQPLARVERLGDNKDVCALVNVDGNLHAPKTWVEGNLKNKPRQFASTVQQTGAPTDPGDLIRSKDR